MLLASVGGSRPPTASSRPPTDCSRPVTACSRPATGRSRPASTARPGTAASTRPGTARPGTGISVLQREITQELESNDASGAFRASLEHELERLEERKLAARQAAQAEVQANEAWQEGLAANGVTLSEQVCELEPKCGLRPCAPTLQAYAGVPSRGNHVSMRAAAGLARQL